jgi:hypothetical protein
MKGEYKRCFGCHELKPLSIYRRKNGNYFDLCLQCRRDNDRIQEGRHGQGKPESWYLSVIRKQGGKLVALEDGYTIIYKTMKFNLVSLAEKAPDLITYRALGFIVADDGTIAELKINFDTDKAVGFKGLTRRDTINKLKDLTGCPIVITGESWTIQNK